jgi:hypothetical protein
VRIRTRVDHGFFGYAEDCTVGRNANAGDQVRTALEIVGADGAHLEAGRAAVEGAVQAILVVAGDQLAVQAAASRVDLACV